MSDTEDAVLKDEEVELSKEERLEAARKKFEEMKKKKKKTKKKALKEEAVSKEGTAEPEGEENTVLEEKTPGEIAPEEKASEEATSEKALEEVKEPKSAKTTEVSAVEELKTETADKETVSKEEKAPIDAPTTATEGDKSSEAPAEPIVEKPHTHTDKYNPISPAPDSEDVKSLKDLIEQQKATIKKLRDENTDLKLSRMDYQDRISELELEVEQLKLYKPAQELPSQVPPVSASPFLASPIKHAKPVFTRNDYASESKQNLADQKQSTDFREQLMVWKGWQVDMTEWHGSTNAQVVAL